MKNSSVYRKGKSVHYPTGIVIEYGSRKAAKHAVKMFNAK